MPEAPLILPNKKLYINSFVLRVMKVINRRIQGTTDTQTDLELTNQFIILTVGSWKKLYHVLYNRYTSHYRLNYFDLSNRLTGVCRSDIPFVKEFLVDYFKTLLISMNLKKDELRSVYYFTRSENLNPHIQLEPVNIRVAGYPCYSIGGMYTIVQPVLMEIYGSDIDFLFHKNFNNMILLLLNKREGEFISTTYNIADSYLNPSKDNYIDWDGDNDNSKDSENNIFKVLGKIDRNEIVTATAVKLNVNSNIEVFLKLQKQGIDLIRDNYNSPFYNYIVDVDMQKYKNFEIWRDFNEY